MMTNLEGLKDELLERRHRTERTFRFVFSMCLGTVFASLILLYILTGQAKKHRDVQIADQQTQISAINAQLVNICVSTPDKQSVAQEACNRLYKNIPQPAITAGAQGPKGDTGAVGAQGAMGLFVQGPKGDPGTTGPIGATGATGSDGKNGADGKDGATGATGPAGAKGAAGSDGSDGRGVTTIYKSITGEDGCAYVFKFTDGTSQSVPCP